MLTLLTRALEMAHCKWVLSEFMANLPFLVCFPLRVCMYMDVDRLFLKIVCLYPKCLVTGTSVLSLVSAYIWRLKQYNISLEHYAARDKSCLFARCYDKRGCKFGLSGLAVEHHCCWIWRQGVKHQDTFLAVGEVGRTLLQIFTSLKTSLTNISPK